MLFHCRRVNDEIKTNNLDEIPFIDSPTEEPSTLRVCDVDVAKEVVNDMATTNHDLNQLDTKVGESFDKNLEAGDHSIVNKNEDVHPVTTPRQRNRARHKVERAKPVSLSLSNVSRERLKSPVETSSGLPDASSPLNPQQPPMLNGSRELSRSGQILLATALRHQSDRDLIISNLNRFDSSRNGHVTSDSDAGDIVPSPTSSSRDSLDEKPVANHIDSKPPYSKPTLSHVDRFSKRVGDLIEHESEFNGAKETHFPSNNNFDATNIYTGGWKLRLHDFLAF